MMSFLRYSKHFLSHLNLGAVFWRRIRAANLFFIPILFTQYAHSEIQSFWFNDGDFANQQSLVVVHQHNNTAKIKEFKILSLQSASIDESTGRLEAELEQHFDLQDDELVSVITKVSESKILMSTFMKLHKVNTDSVHYKNDSRPGGALSRSSSWRYPLFNMGDGVLLCKNTFKYLPYCGPVLKLVNQTEIDFTTDSQTSTSQRQSVALNLLNPQITRIVFFNGNYLFFTDSQVAIYNRMVLRSQANDLDSRNGQFNIERHLLRIPDTLVSRINRPSNKIGGLLIDSRFSIISLTVGFNSTLNERWIGSALYMANAVNGTLIADYRIDSPIIGLRSERNQSPFINPYDSKIEIHVSVIKSIWIGGRLSEQRIDEEVKAGHVQSIEFTEPLIRR